jgi:hypothetical protein
MIDQNVELAQIGQLLNEIVSSIEDESNDKITTSLSVKRKIEEEEESDKQPVNVESVKKKIRKSKSSDVKKPDVWSNISDTLFSSHEVLFKEMFVQKCKCVELAKAINHVTKDKQAIGGAAPLAVSDSSSTDEDEDSVFTTNSSTSVSSTEVPKRKPLPCYRNFTVSLCRDCLNGKKELDDTDTSSSCRFIGWRKLKQVPIDATSSERQTLTNKYRDMGFLELGDASKADSALWSLDNSKENVTISAELIQNSVKMMCFLEKNFLSILDYEINMRLKYAKSRYY